MPLEMDASLPAFSAMLLYARVSVGDTIALFLDEVQADGLQHSINGAPTWRPRTYTQMAYQEAPGSAWVCRKWPSSEKPYIDGAGTFIAVSPYYRITGVRIVTAVDVLKSTVQDCRRSDGHGKIYRFRIARSGSKTEMEIKEGIISLRSKSCLCGL